MMKTIKNICLLIILFSCSLVLVACGTKETYDTTYNVSFVTGIDDLQIPSVSVREGYHITGTSINLNQMSEYAPEAAIFRGWYEDSEYTKPWNIDTYRVSDNMSLYAKWSFYQKSPTEIKTSDVAFSKTITWIQDKVDQSTNFKVELLKASVKEVNVVDYDKDPTGNTTTKVEVPTYKAGTEFEVSGSIVVNDYEVSFTIDTPLLGGIYRAIVTSDNGTETYTSSQDGLFFKGTGTKEDPYLIYNEADLKYLTTHSYDESSYAILKNDVTIRSVYNEKIGCVYDGEFNGNGKTINIRNNSGLFYELGPNANFYGARFTGSLSGSDPSIGVVANYNQGYIHNVESASVSVASYGGKVNDFSTLSVGAGGGIVGTNKANGRITQCTITSGQANVIAGTIGIGGIAGVNYGKIYGFNSTTTPCSAIVGAYNGKELAKNAIISYAGCAVGVNFGIVEQVNIDGKINCRRIDYDQNYVTGSSNIGGVVGYNAKGGVISDCLFQGMRCVGDTNVGGIVGYNDGTVTNCFTGRRLRKPSGTVMEERMYISPVIGTINVGGICGKCGPNSVISNCFSTANVWAYGEKAYSVAEIADNCIYVNKNHQERTSQNYLGRTYGVPVSNDLLAPVGNNNLLVDVTDRVNLAESHPLGSIYKVDDNGVGKNVIDTARVIEYLHVLGNHFGYNNTYGISLLWQSGNTHPLSYYEGE